MLLGWLGLDSRGATAPSACVPPLASRVGPSFPSSQLCRSHISQRCPSLWEHRAQGCATEATEEGDSTLAGYPKSPTGDSGGFPSVESLCPGSCRLGAAWARGVRCGSGRAASDAAALTSILCCSAQGIKGQRGLCGEAARRLLLGQNMKGFHFPCLLWLLASLLAAVRVPWGCRAGCGPGRSVKAPGGLWVLLLLLGHSQSGL